jgi:hypothetical protein
MKVFGTGLQRTGTSSLTRALNTVGIRTRQFPKPLYGDIHHEIINRFNGFTDFPIPLLYRSLDTAYPGSKFIHTIRDEVSWLKSVEWLFTVGAVKFNWDKHEIFSRVHTDFYGTAAFDAERFLARYRAYNEEVQAYFASRTADFLVIELAAGDGYEQICPFLGVTIPATPFPHNNRQQNLAEVVIRKIWRRIKPAGR